MMDEEEIRHIRPSSTEGNLEQLKKVRLISYTLHFASYLMAR